NTVWLWRYIRQESENLGFTPEDISETRGPKDPPVVITGADSFRAGGFDWSFSEDLVKSVCVMGQPGSGKTACVLNSMLEGVLSVQSHGLKSAVLILDPTGGYRSTIEALCKRLRRGSDLHILSPESWPEFGGTPLSVAWNPLDTDEDALEVSARFITV